MWTTPTKYGNLKTPVRLQLNENCDEFTLDVMPIYLDGRDMEVSITQQTDERQRNGFSQVLHVWGGEEIYTIHWSTNQGRPIDVVVVKQECDGHLRVWQADLSLKQLEKMFPGKISWVEAVSIIISHVVNLAISYSWICDEGDTRYTKVSFKIQGESV